MWDHVKFEILTKEDNHERRKCEKK
jgi:hypothetical protein